MICCDKMSSDSDHVFGEDTGSDIFEVVYVKPDPDAPEDGVEVIPKQRESKRLKVKKEQYDQIDSFMKKHSEAMKHDNNDLWNKLVDELNSMGPPTFTNVEWRRKWSCHKYDCKRQKLRKGRKGSEDLNQGIKLKRYDQDPSIVSVSGEAVNDPSIVPVSGEAVNVPSIVPVSGETVNTKIIEFLAALVETNKAVAAKQDIIINNQIRSNELLEEIANNSKKSL